MRDVSRGKIRVLCVGRDLRGGGATSVSLILLEHLDRSRFEISLFYLRDEGELRALVPADLEPKFGASNRQGSIRRLAPTLARLLNVARESDVIFALQNGRPLHFAILVGGLARRPVVGWVHDCWSQWSYDLEPWHLWVAQHMYPHADRLIAVSEGVAKELLDFVPRLRGKVVSVPSPLAVDQIRTRAQAGIPSWAEHIFDKRTVLACGGLNCRKGFDVLLRAFAQLIHKLLDLHLLILGEGKGRSSLERLVDRLGLRDRVFMPGFQSNPYPFFTRADVFVLSSRYEGLGMVLLEALCLGVPTVAVDCPHGPREILQDGRAGILVPPENPIAMAEALRQVLCHKDLRENLRAAGMQRAMDYEVTKVMPLFETLFLQCSEQGRLAKARPGKRDGTPQ